MDGGVSKYQRNMQASRRWCPQLQGWCGCGSNWDDSHPASLTHAASVCGRPATRTHDFVVWLGAVHHLRQGWIWGELRFGMVGTKGRWGWGRGWEVGLIIRSQDCGFGWRYMGWKWMGFNDFVYRW